MHAAVVKRSNKMTLETSLLQRFSKLCAPRSTIGISLEMDRPSTAFELVSKLAVPDSIFDQELQLRERNRYSSGFSASGRWLECIDHE